MSKNSKLIVTILVFIVLAVGGWYVYTKTRPTQQEINVQKEQILVVPSDILDDSTIQAQLKLLKQNGTLPITVSSKEKGRSNPFADF